MSEKVLDELFNGTLKMPLTTPDAQPAAGSAPDAEKKVTFAPLAQNTLTELPINLLHDFATGMEKQPFRPYSSEDMEALQQNIRERGIIQPLIVRPLGNHNYEIIAGHNRRSAARAVGYEAVPCIVRELTDDEAILQMISTNLQQRKNLLPSEKAFAYKIQLDAMKRQGFRTDLTSRQLVGRLETADLVGQEVGECGRQIQRYIRLTYLTPALLQAVDEKKLGLTIGATLSFLSCENQQIVENFFMGKQRLGIDQRTADKLRELESAGELTEDRLRQVFLSSPVKPLRKIRVNYKTIKSYFKEDVTEKEVQETIQAALKFYFDEKSKGERP